MASNTVGFHRFAREYARAPAKATSASPEAMQRFESDSMRFPPRSYEANSLLWKGNRVEAIVTHREATATRHPGVGYSPTTRVTTRTSSTAPSTSELFGRNQHASALCHVCHFGAGPACERSGYVYRHGARTSQGVETAIEAHSSGTGPGGGLPRHFVGRGNAAGHEVAVRGITNWQSGLGRNVP